MIPQEDLKTNGLEKLKLKDNKELVDEYKLDRLTPDQKKAFEEISEWLKDDSETYKTLSGNAGTGKTFLIDYIVNHALTNEGMKVMVTATTNKAVKVLKSKVNCKPSLFSTIHSLLNIKPKRVGDKEVFEAVFYDKFDAKMDINDYDLVIIDECSMISKKLLKIIEDKLNTASIFDGSSKVLFVGDPAQLQPINETVSKTFDDKFNVSHLTTIVRHGDVIAERSTLLRSTSNYVPFNSLISPPTIRYTNVDELKEYFKNFRRFPDQYRFLTWTNNSVKKWNYKLRVFDYGYIPEEDFNVGDIVIANSPCEINMDKIIMMNSQEGIVLKVERDVHVIRIEDKDVPIPYYRLFVEVEDHTEEQDNVILNVVEDKYRSLLDKTLKKLSTWARENKTWQKFWYNKKFFHDITHCYAMTTHKSQGSSFNNVILNISDYDRNRDIEERNQLAYVGVTRAIDSVLLFQ